MNGLKNLSRIAAHGFIHDDSGQMVAIRVALFTELWIIEIASLRWLFGLG